jgi:ubiquinone/menaquinone biosynthesis C-methylase UbiE
MAQQNSHPSTYKQGYSDSTIATHLLRTAEIDAAFLLPHIKKTDQILDAGCGPGTITTSFAKYVPEGAIVGLDISAEVLQKAKKLATEANIPTEGPGSVVFVEGNVLDGLAYPDATFDVIYASQLFGHLPMPDLPLKALIEMRRVLKPGGIIATRDGFEQHFYPRSLDLDRLWLENQRRALGKGKDEIDPTALSMPALFRKAGFDADGGKVRLGAGNTTYSGPDARKWLASRGTGQLKEGDAFYQSWLDAGITVDEIQEALRTVQKWADTEDAWFTALQIEMLGWK